jgi:LVIVD repeat
VTVAGNYAFLANYTDGLRAYDISTPSHPVNVGFTDANGGESYSAVVAGNFAYLANGSDGVRVYSFGTASVAPKLSIGLTNGTVLISWPISASGFNLKQNINLATTNWTAVTNMPVTNALSNQVTITSPSGRHFYRLSSP